MNIASKLFATAATLTLMVGGAAVAAGAADASSTGCAFTNGCATLHGTDANGSAVAMDAKYKNKSEILIGYPDNSGDNATSFDGVLHYTKATSSTTWSDTDLAPIAFPDVSPSSSPVHITSFHEDLNTGELEFKVTGGTAPYTATLSGLAGGSVTSPIDAASSSYNGEISVEGDTLTPGVYNNIVLTITDSNTPTAHVVSYTGTARVFGHKVTVAGGNKPFYTFVYAANGVWSNMCVTDENGSGALRLETCTLGHNLGQDFTVDSSNGLLGSGQAHVSNVLAANANGASSSCLTDPSTSNPATPQSDAADQLPPGGRQLYVNGSCAAGVNLWSWNT